MIAGNLLQQVYNLADTLIVGRFIGPDALASVGSSYTLMIFITSVIIGLCMGSGAFFSADYGAGDHKRMKEDIWLSLWFILSVSMGIYMIIYPGMDIIQKIMQIPPELREMTEEYITVVFSGIIFMFLYNFFAYILRAMGNSVVPLVFLAASSAVNIALDIWFIIGFDMGVGGAALATLPAKDLAGAGIACYSLSKIPQTDDSGACQQLWGRNNGFLCRRGKNRYHRVYAGPGIRKCLFSVCFSEPRCRK